MERTGALVEGGIVRNIIVWGDESEAQYEAEGWDYAVETTNLEVKPAIGWTYSEADGFRPAQPYASWTWNGIKWVAPTPEPDTGEPHQWNETTLSWEPITTE